MNIVIKIISLSIVLAVMPLYSNTAQLIGSVDLEKQTFVNLSVVGTASLRSIEVETLKVTGPLTFKELLASGLLKVVGVVTGNTGTIKKMVVVGLTDLNNVVIDELIVNGMLKLTSSEVGSIEVTSGEIILQESTISGDLRVHLPSQFNKKVTLQLKDSAINGSILCDEGVYLKIIKTDSSTIGSIVVPVAFPKQSWWEWVCELFKSK